MFIEDLRNDFYNLLLGNRVLLLVHYDVDAICTCKILQGLFKSDNISYTLVPVGGISELKTAYEENNEEVKYVVLVNCGGTIDLVDILQPEEDVVFFVLDSHKPTDVCNVYSDGQVRLVYRDEEENIPNFDDIFRDDDEENEEEMPSGREDLEAFVERRRQRREWETKRNDLMFNYTQFSYYGKPSACIVVELAWLLCRSGVEYTWAGCIAVSAYAATHTRSPAQALLDAHALHRHLAAQLPSHGASVSMEKDAFLPLYRTWSLENALKYSPVVAPHLRLHSLAGADRLRQLLADMGIPLQQARQAYRSMDVELRRSLLDALDAAADKHHLPRLTHATYVLRRDHCAPLAALDCVYCVMALLELEGPGGFQLALASVDTSSAECEARQRGLGAARRGLAAAAALAGATLAARALHHAGPFAHFTISEGAAECEWGPWWLAVCARWAGAGAGRGAGAVLVAAPRGRTVLLCGVPPPQRTDTRNLFGAAFEQAAAKCGASVSLDHFDSAVVTLPAAQRPQFLDALTALLA